MVPPFPLTLLIATLQIARLADTNSIDTFIRTFRSCFIIVADFRAEDEIDHELSVPSTKFGPYAPFPGTWLNGSQLFFHRQNCLVIFHLGKNKIKKADPLFLFVEKVFPCEGEQELCYASNGFLISDQNNFLENPVGFGDLFFRRRFDLVQRGIVIVGKESVLIGITTEHPCKGTRKLTLSTAEYSNLHTKTVMEGMFRAMFSEPCPSRWEFASHGFFVLTGNQGSNFWETVTTWPAPPEFLHGVIMNIIMNLQNSTSPEYIKKMRLNIQRPESPAIGAYVNDAGKASTASYQFYSKIQHHNFISCSGWKKKIGMTALLAPFEENLWIIGASALVLTSILFKTVLVRLGLPDSVLFFIPMLLFEQGLSWSKKLEGSVAFKSFMGMILLSGLVLTNSYRGIVTSNLAAPIPAHGIATVEEAMDADYRILIPELDANKMLISTVLLKYSYPPMNYTDLATKWAMVGDLSHLVNFMGLLNNFRTLPQGELRTKRERIMNHLVLIRWKNTLPDTRDESEYMMTDENLMKRCNKTFVLAGHENATDEEKLLLCAEAYVPPEYVIPTYPDPLLDLSLRQELALCNGSIYLAEEEQLHSFLTTVQPLTTEKFYYGRDRYMSDSRVWAMAGIEWDRLHIIYLRFQSLVQSGIFLRVMESRIRQKLEEVLGFIPLSTQSNFVQATYITFWTCIILSLAAFLLERIRAGLEFLWKK